MKKSLLIVVLAVAFTLALAGIAYATWGDTTYMNWSTAAPNTGLNSPHAGYSTTTRECGVCHAVHNARYGGQALLPKDINNACNYCHVDGGGSSKIVYAGVVSNYQTDTNKNHSNGCTTCHSVHGASTVVTLDGVGNNPNILRLTSPGFGTAPSPGVGATGAPAGGTAGWNVPLQTVEPVWCANLCHHYGAGPEDGNANYSYYQQGVNGRSHVMTATVTATYKSHNAAVNYNGQVAWVASDQCKSCHASNTQGGSAGGFPHYTDGVRFLTARASGASTVAAATDSDADGVCTRCHRSGAGTNGVGIDF